ncbi:MAG: TIGR01777 family oxidoreductase [Cyclobacteriaceae bacterium]|nr:TIGR01777 family oxidoreductase [Cyclobacteriaceae bacterium]
MSKNVLITGASGTVGSVLTELLIKKGYKVSHLSRSGSAKRGSVRIFGWDLAENYIEPAALENAHIIIHLAGAGVADERWTDKRKKEIKDSRIFSTRLLFEKLKQIPHKVETFISASAVGIYGNSGKALMREDANIHPSDFLADVTQSWEEEVFQIQELNIRTLALRIGVVLSNQGGALEKMALPVKYGAGAALGSGEQIMSWIHIDDLCEMFCHLIQKESYSGAFNAVAPNPVSNKEFTRTLAKVLNKPIFLPPVPAFVLKIMLGEMSAMVLGGSNVSAEKILKTGFAFKYSTAEDALKDLLKTNN